MNLGLILTSLAFVAGFLTIFAFNLLITDLFIRDQQQQRKRLEEDLRNRVKQRVHAEMQSSNLGEIAAQAQAEMAQPKNVIEHLGKMIAQAGLQVDPRRLLATCFVLGIGIGGLACILAPRVYYGLPFGLIAFWMPIFYVRAKRNKRYDRLRSQLPDALELMGRILKAGQTMDQAMQSVSTEFPEPIALEFALCREQQNLGLNADVALRSLADRTGVIEVKIFVVSLLIHRRTGGNLTQLLEQLSSLLRERFKLRGKIRSLTAEGRFQALALLAMPPILFLALLVLNREYAEKLWDHPELLVGGAISMGMGMLWIRKIVNFEF